MYFGGIKKSPNLSLHKIEAEAKWSPLMLFKTLNNSPTYALKIIITITTKLHSILELASLQRPTT